MNPPPINISGFSRPTPQWDEIHTTKWHQAVFDNLIPPGFYDIRRFGATGKTGVDDTAAIQRAIKQCQADGGGSVYIPRGTYSIQGKLTTGPVVSTPALTINGSYIRFFGEGNSSEILINDPGAGVDDDGIHAKTSSWDSFQIKGNSSYIIFENLRFRGLNDPFKGVWPFNNTVTGDTGACIANREFATSSHDVTVRNCYFTNLYGHIVRTSGGGEYRWRIENCTAFQCTNGMNVNGDETVYIGGHLIECNGIECSGDRSSAYGVHCKGTGAAVAPYVGALGVVMGGGDLCEEPQVIGCSIKDVRAGIAFTGCHRGVVMGNVVNGVVAGFHGIQMAQGSFVGVHGGTNMLIGNTVRTVDGGGGNGIYIVEGGCVIASNYCEAGNNGIRIDSSVVDVLIDNNKLSGVVSDLSVDGAATDVRVSNSNVYLNGKVTWGATLYNIAAPTSCTQFIGSGVPTLAVPNGSTFLRTDGGALTTLYVREAGAWVAK